MSYSNKNTGNANARYDVDHCHDCIGRNCLNSELGGFNEGKGEKPLKPGCDGEKTFSILDLFALLGPQYQLKGNW